MSAVTRASMRAGVQGSPKQIEDLAFNMAGFAVEDESGNREKYQVIVARWKNSKNWSTIINKVQQGGVKLRGLKECSGSPHECRIEPIYISI
ncbi:uncharacterized protein Z518_06717 [Rhinocladiella mackenziei CBS 650.93]|uniref:Uncharacterized protein n=1 Tax=Rhinocladiella mackenziei CBS 650.93 TaxID=1442369 RepID=A0A0D2IIP3_9EURO|nr:uncharacterized protein Z518_06717 [Rhinocladiella mackenziei CBS 650.93]KIX03166.1 hypothetical protein Z518_06717 [Rhinocladiella mackenziei CBS 650.93]